jgi:hypothetical protein
VSPTIWVPGAVGCRAWAVIWSVMDVVVDVDDQQAHG